MNEFYNEELLKILMDNKQKGFDSKPIKQQHISSFPQKIISNSQSKVAVEKPKFCEDY